MKEVLVKDLKVGDVYSTHISRPEMKLRFVGYDEDGDLLFNDESDDIYYSQNMEGFTPIFIDQSPVYYLVES